MPTGGDAWDTTERWLRVVAFGVGAVVFVRETWPDTKADPAAVGFAVSLMTGASFFGWFKRKEDK